MLSLQIEHENGWHDACSVAGYVGTFAHDGEGVAEALAAIKSGLLIPESGTEAEAVEGPENDAEPEVGQGATEAVEAAPRPASAPSGGRIDATKIGAFSVTALAWHRAGIGAVLPTVENDKMPCVGGEYDGLHWWGRERPGYHVETVTEEQIRAWDEQWPGAGVCCSPRGAYFALDIDHGYKAKTGLFNLAALLYPDLPPETARNRLRSRLQETVRVTARPDPDGGQRWLRLTEEQQARMEAEGLRLKRNPCKDVEILDYRYEGVLPGTRHPETGNLYRADLGGEPITFYDDVEAGVAAFVDGITECPEEWFEALTEPARYGAGASGDMDEWVRANCVDPDGEPGPLLRGILAAYEQRKEPYVGANHEIAKRVQLDLLNRAAYDGQPGLLTAVAAAETVTQSVHGGLKHADDWERLWEGLSDGHLPELLPVSVLLDEEGVPVVPLSRKERGKPEPVEALQPNEIRERFPLLDIASLLDPDRPPRRWFLADVVPEGDHVSIVAPGGTGKSLFALALSIEAVRGSASFVGREINLPETAKVAYVDMENSEDDWAERLRDLGVSQEEAERVRATRFFPFNLPALRGLDTETGASQLIAVLDAYGIGKGDVLVLDSTQRITEGPENDNDTIRNLYNFTSAELKRRGITVIRTDNTGWDESRVRGASGKRDDVGYSWLMEPVGGETFTLTNSKRRAAGDAARIRFTRARVEGVLRFLPAVESAEKVDTEKVLAFKRAVLTVLKRAFDGAEKEHNSGLLTQVALLRAVREEGASFKNDGSAYVWLGELVDVGAVRVEGGEEIVNEKTGKVTKSAKYYGWVSDLDEGEVGDSGEAY